MITDDALANVMLDFHIDAWLSNHINLTFPTTPRMVYFLFKEKTKCQMDFNRHMIANLTAQNKIQRIISPRSDISPKIGNRNLQRNCNEMLKWAT